MDFAIVILGTIAIAMLLAFGGIAAIVVGYKLYAKQRNAEDNTQADSQALRSFFSGGAAVGAVLMLTSLGWGLLSAYTILAITGDEFQRIVQGEPRHLPPPRDRAGFPRFRVACCDREPSTTIENTGPTAPIAGALREARRRANSNFGFDPALGKIAARARAEAWPGEFYRQAATLCAEDSACDSALLLEVVGCYAEATSGLFHQVCNSSGDCRAAGRDPDGCAGTECEFILTPGDGDPLSAGDLVCVGECRRWGSRC